MNRYGDNRVVRGGGLSFLTSDPLLIAAVNRCAELERQLAEAHHQEVARFRTLRHDVREIKRALARKEPRS